MPVASEFDLLCEHCGYRLEGLAAEGVCPECARPVAESLPQRRRGTPWQRSASIGALGRTVWLAMRSLRSPRLLWDAARVGDAADAAALVLVLCIASLFAGAHAAALGLAVVWGDRAFSDLWEVAVGVVLSLLLMHFAMGGSLLVLLVLTGIERAGIRTFGRMHGRRITRAVATTIVSHASAGWVVGAALLTPAWLLGRGLVAAADDVALLRWQLVYVFPVILPTAAGLLGLLLFEVMTWQGVMRLRYANRTRPDDENQQCAGAA